MPTKENKGGNIRNAKNAKQSAAVTLATATGAGAAATWVITLENVPDLKNFKKDDQVIYNSKGTANSNADNTLVITKVEGPCKLTCTGPMP